MFALVQDDDDVSRLEARLLVALAAEGDPLVVRHALVDVYLEDLLRPHHLARGGAERVRDMRRRKLPVMKV